MTVILLGAACGGYVADAHALDLGRLFTTPAERLQLDKLRQQNTPRPEPGGAQRAAGAVVQAPTNKAVVLNGVVRKGNGAQLVWINGRQAQGQNGSDGVRIEGKIDQNASVAVSLPGKQRAVRIKPGQQWDPHTGRVTERYRNTTRDADSSAPHPVVAE